MKRPDAVEFAHIAAEISQSSNVQDTLDNIIVAAQDHLGVALVAVLLQVRKRLRSATVSDPLMEHIVRAAIDHDRTPSLSAMRGTAQVSVPDVRQAHSWPQWAAVMNDVGIGSALCTRLRAGDRTLGSIGFYFPEPEQFSREDRSAAWVFSYHASIALLHAEQETSLQEAVDARHKIGQAQGVLMERHKIGPERAFSVLRRYSQDYNVKLRIVAREVVRTGADQANRLEPS